ncbi:MAG: NTP transferase domain-containing protein, partial [Dehalococcoidia bacterium]
MVPWSSVVLAAGEGRRMHSKTPKVLHAVAGREMLLYVLDAVGEAEPQASVVVVVSESSRIRDLVKNGAELVTQAERRGTGHALMQSRPLLEGRVDQILVVNGDHALFSGTTLRRLMEHHLTTEAAMTILTSQA